MNINHPVIITLEILFEIVGDNIQVDSQIALLDFTSSINWILALVFLFSFLHITMLLINLKTKLSKKEKERILKNKNEETANYIKNINKTLKDSLVYYYSKCINFFRNNLRCPNFFEAGSKF